MNRSRGLSSKEGFNPPKGLGTISSWIAASQAAGQEVRFAHGLFPRRRCHERNRSTAVRILYTIVWSGRRGGVALYTCGIFIGYASCAAAIVPSMTVMRGNAVRSTDTFAKWAELRQVTNQSLTGWTQTCNIFNWIYLCPNRKLNRKKFRFALE